MNLKFYKIKIILKRSRGKINIILNNNNSKTHIPNSIENIRLLIMMIMTKISIISKIINLNPKASNLNKNNNSTKKKFSSNRVIFY